MSDDLADDAVEAQAAGSPRDRPVAPGLYLVSTPIGNLEDITLRALRVLRGVDVIACEDTRQAAKLLQHFGIATRTVSYHRHNEVGRANDLLEQLQGGGRVAVITDAGTPGIADPGAELTSASIAAGVPVFPVPGASALLAAVVASGALPPETGGFRFHSFLPSKAGQRRTALEAVRSSSEPALEVFYETPHRIVEALADVEAVFGAAQPVVVARELTKLYEEFLRGTAAEVRATLAGRDTVRGEMVLMLPLSNAGADPHAQVEAPIGNAIRALIAAGLTEKDALKQIARERKLGKSDVYREWQRSQRRP